MDLLWTSIKRSASTSASRRPNVSGGSSPQSADFWILSKMPERRFLVLLADSGSRSSRARSSRRLNMHSRHLRMAQITTRKIYRSTAKCFHCTIKRHIVNFSRDYWEGDGGVVVALDQPQSDEGEQLDDSEEVHTMQRYKLQIDVVRLVLARHEEQQQSVKMSISKASHRYLQRLLRNDTCQRTAGPSRIGRP